MYDTCCISTGTFSLFANRSMYCIVHDLEFALCSGLLISDRLKEGTDKANLEELMLMYVYCGDK